ncbi:hypothetical protein KKI24_13985 [bacterium]|nr:hypothetical protein [bacterium]
MVSANRLLLSKAALKKIVLCSYIMSGIDGYMDEREFEVIAAFTDKNWLESFGDLDDFYKEIDSEILDFFIPARGKFQLNQEGVISIISDLTVEEETILLQLMTDVMEADGIIDPAEVSLMKVIRQHITSRSTA